MELITEKYIFFWGSEMSNWSDDPVKYRGHSFYSSENAFMWAKAMHFEDEVAANTILNGLPDERGDLHPVTPSQAKKLGRGVVNFDAEEWSKVSYNIMVEVNYAKWNRTEHLRELLIMTAPKIIVEASPHDVVWGIGLHWTDENILDEKNWRGQNLLGVALMAVRDMLINDKNGD